MGVSRPWPPRRSEDAGLAVAGREVGSRCTWPRRTSCGFYLCPGQRKNPLPYHAGWSSPRDRGLIATASDAHAAIEPGRNAGRAEFSVGCVGQCRISLSRAEGPQIGARGHTAILAFVNKRVCDAGRAYPSVAAGSRMPAMLDADQIGSGWARKGRSQAALSSKQHQPE